MTDRVSFLNVILKHPTREDDIEALVNAIKLLSNVAEVNIVKQNIEVEHMAHCRTLSYVSKKICDYNLKILDDLRKNSHEVLASKIINLSDIVDILVD